MGREASDQILERRREELRAIALERLPAEDASLLCSLARPAVRLVGSDDAVNSHLGGDARLPPNLAWPRWGDRALGLVAVLDLAELRLFHVDLDLPVEGFVSFFYDVDEQMAWGFDPSHCDGWRVVYCPPDQGTEVAPPDGATSFVHIGLVPEQLLTIPGWEEPEVESLLPRRPSLGERERAGSAQRRQFLLDEEKRDAFWAVAEAWRPLVEPDGCLDHQVGGWPELQQGPIWEECDTVSRGYPLGNAEDYRRAHAASLPPTTDDWRLLLQLASDEDAGWMWGDVGALYYSVRTSLAAPRKFDESWMVLQCG